MPINWSNASEEARNHIVQAGQLYLDGQVRLATSADQRAAALAGIFTAAGTAVLAGLIAVHLSDLTIKFTLPIYIGGGVSVVMFLLAGSVCIWSALPLEMWLPGGEPETWYRDIQSGKPFPDSMAELAELIQEKISENRKYIEANAKRFRFGAICGVISPGVGTLLWVAILTCQSNHP
ncbi:hypothetical protein [Oceanibaculum nanhaiense]|uniref:hypothetical protein n=1 Tax=Oceanibaculum nanhaiense TaxID=1909734 RepID=UPI003D2A2CA0